MAGHAITWVPNYISCSIEPEGTSLFLNGRFTEGIAGHHLMGQGIHFRIGNWIGWLYASLIGNTGGVIQLARDQRQTLADFTPSNFLFFEIQRFAILINVELEIFQQPSLGRRQTSGEID